MNQQDTEGVKWVRETVARRISQLREEWAMLTEPERFAAYRERRLAEIEDEGKVLAGDRDPDRVERVKKQLGMPVGR